MLLFFPAAPLGKEKDIDEGKSRGDSMAQMLLSLFYISRIFQNLKFLYVSIGHYNEHTLLLGKNKKERRDPHEEDFYGKCKTFEYPFQ